MSVAEIVDDFFKLDSKSNYLLLSPIVKIEKENLKKELLNLVKKGFVRFRIDNEIISSENIPELKKNLKHNIEVVVDRIKIDKKYKNRITQSVETGLNLSDGVIYFYDTNNSKNHIFSSKFIVQFLDLLLKK